MRGYATQLVNDLDLGSYFSRYHLDGSLVEKKAESTQAGTSQNPGLSGSSGGPSPLRLELSHRYEYQLLLLQVRQESLLLACP